jgi:hypothetical protein
VGSQRRRLFALAFAVALVVLGSVPSNVFAASGYKFVGWRELPPLQNSERWVLQGKKLPSGACRYSYESDVEELPESGWEIRSIAIDMEHCAKVMEEGVPTFTRRPVLDGQTETLASAEGGGFAALASTRGAWQQVTWYDIIGLWLTYDATQIHWTYNGSTVWAGSVDWHMGWRTGTGWKNIFVAKSGSYGSGNSFYKGETWSSFKNDVFCWPFPTVYTYYYFNRMWGYADGHATRTQSSDSVDECLPFHMDIVSEYGEWS